MAWSLYHIDQTGTHSGRIKGLKQLDKKDPQVRKTLSQYARWWRRHVDYWDNEAQIQIHDVRYEDLKQHGLSSLLGVLNFLLPPEDQPSLEQVACALELDPVKVSIVPILSVCSTSRFELIQ